MQHTLYAWDIQCIINTQQKSLMLHEVRDQDSATTDMCKVSEGLGVPEGCWGGAMMRHGGP